MDVDEQVSIFLHIVAHNAKNRVMICRFHHSAETISRCFTRVCNAVIRLHPRLLKKPEPVSDNSTHQRWKWFKNCLGALDGTYIKCLVPLEDKPRYHLNEWRDGHQPTTAKEFYNMKHSSARNVIERCFGILKARWGILKDNSYYPVELKIKIIVACCLLHSYIRQEMPIDPLENDYEPDEGTEDLRVGQQEDNTLMSGLQTSGLHFEII